MPVRDLFRRTFGGDPHITASAPGRANFLGEHLDYNGGDVLPFAVEPRLHIAMRPAEEWSVISSVDHQRRALDEPGYPAYLRGVRRALCERGLAIPAAEIAISSDVPAGAGLSSSAALSVAAARAMAALAGTSLGSTAVADVAYRAEHDHVGVACGRMDQLAIAKARAGHILHIRTASGSRRHLSFSGKVLLVDSGEHRALTDGMLDGRREECRTALRLLQQRWPRLRRLSAFHMERMDQAMALLPEMLGLRLRHVATEQRRVRRAVELLRAGDLHGVGRLVLESHRSLRDWYQCTTSRTDAMVESAMHHGAWGARLIGAGWGGVVMVLADEGQLERIGDAMNSEMARRQGEKLRRWITGAERGASRPYIWQHAR